MTNKVYVLRIGVLLLISFAILSGCNSITNSDTASKLSSHTTVNSQEDLGSSSIPKGSTSIGSKPKDITIIDLDVDYKGVTLNGKTSFEVLTTQLHVPIGAENDNIMNIVSHSVNDTDYYWYRVSYPSKEHPDFTFDYLYNATLKTGRIVSMDLKNIPTKRGVVVGDSIDKIKLVYGNDIVSEPQTKTTSAINFYVNNEYLNFTYERTSGKIIEVYIDYDTNKAMEEIDIPSLVD